MAGDRDLFLKAMADARPLKGVSRRAPVAAKPAPATPMAVAPRPPVPRPTVEPDLDAGGSGFDRDLSRALSRRRLEPDLKLDLHGLTLAAAERAVRRFLAEAQGADARVALVVTGKGLREEGGRVLGGRIRGELMGWLNRADNRAYVRAVRAAHPHHGGGGAFYLLLRRRSSASSRSLRATPQR